MRQLHVVGSYPIGTHTFVLWQLMGARRLGHESLVLAANTGNDPGYQLAHQLGLDDEVAIYANYRTTSPWWADPRRLTPAISNAANSRLYGHVMGARRKSFFCKLLSLPEIRNVDLVQVHFTSWAIDVGLPLAQLIKRPCVVTAHGAVADTPISLLRHVQQHANAIVVVSDHERQTWIERTGSDARLYRVWNGLPLGKPTVRDTRPDNAPLALASIGRLEKEKRIGDLVEAVAELHARGLACTLDVFGEGPLRNEIQARIGRHGLNDQIRLRGNVPHEAMMGQLAHADILVHACETEPFGLAMIEGMAAGLPVVAARSNGACEIVVHAKTGYLYSPGDVPTLTDHLACLAHSPQLAQTMGLAGRQRVEQDFSIDAHMQNMDQIWHVALSEFNAQHKTPGATV